MTRIESVQNISLTKNSDKYIPETSVNKKSEKIIKYACNFFTAVVSLTLVKYFCSKICIDNTNSYNEFCKDSLNDFDCIILNFDKKIICKIAETIEKFGIFQSALSFSSIYIAGDFLVNA